MVQFINLPQTGQSKAAGQIGAGLGRAVQEQGQYNQQRSRLQEAFGQVNPGGDYMQNLGKLAPALLSTPGGAQLLGEIAPELRKYQQANRDELKAENLTKLARSGNVQPEQPTFSQEGNITEQSEEPGKLKIENPTAEDIARDPSLLNYQGGGTNPYESVQEQPYKRLTPQQQYEKATELFQSDKNARDPNASFDKSLSQVKAIEDLKSAESEKVNEQRAKRQETERLATQGMIKSAEDQGLISKDKDEQQLVTKFALESKDLPLEKQWPAVKAKLDEYNVHKNNIERVGSLKNPLIAKVFSPNALYKDKEKITDELQGDLDYFRRNGLYDKARQLIADATGFGAEDTEAALFPFTPKEKNELGRFGKNPDYTTKKVSSGQFAPGSTGRVAPSREIDEQFPGESSNMNPTNFNKFKGDILSYIKDNPRANLISLRGYLNQNLKYSYQDISKAFTELRNEKQFNPDPIQNSQLLFVNQAPLPGLGAMFQNWLTGTK